MLLRGLHVDEDGRPVFDGAFIHVAGGGKGGFDYRFAMPTRHFSVLEDHIYPTDFFPFATAASRDPVTGVEGSVLDRARALGAIPKLFYVNNSSEYWNRAATSAAGSKSTASPTRCRRSWANRSRRWCPSRTPMGSIRAASRCRKCWCRSAPGPASTRATAPRASHGPAAGGMARSCPSRA